MITMSQDILRAQQPTGAPADAAEGGGASSSQAAAAAAAAAAPPAATSSLPSNVADQIKAAQAKAALQGKAPSVWAIGAKCLAQYSSDEQFYPATVQSVTEAGNFVVLFDGYGNTEEVGRSTWGRERRRRRRQHQQHCSQQQRQQQQLPAVAHSWRTPAVVALAARRVVLSLCAPASPARSARLPAMCPPPPGCRPAGGSQCRGSPARDAGGVHGGVGAQAEAGAGDGGGH